MYFAFLEVYFAFVEVYVSAMAMNSGRRVGIQAAIIETFVSALTHRALVQSTESDMQ